jgi:hypothetical protein
MDILLLSITVVSLVVALVMSAIAWRLSRQEATRRTARVAALAAAARDEGSAADSGDTLVGEPRPVLPVQAHPAPNPVSLREEFPREEWPLQTEVTAPADFVAERPVPTPGTLPSGLSDSFLGSAVAAPPSGGRQRGLAYAAAVLFVVLFAGGYYLVFGDDAPTPAVVASASGSPLELISLRHERRAGSLAITGLVRNPSAGQAVERLSAVVFLFDPQGAFLTSSRAGVDYTQLAPGDESPFVIRVDAPSNVARYRVSFRTDDGLVPHVDRRGQEPIAGDVP